MSTHDTSESTPARMGFAKPAIGLLLILIAAGAVIVGIAREGSTSQATEPAVTPADGPRVVTVYYLHGQTRCPTCRKIEASTERVVRERFTEELDAGILQYEAVNYDSPANQHYYDDYDLSFGSVVVQGVGDDQPWENLAEVWTLIHEDPIAFESYLVDHIKPMLAGNG